MAKRSTNRMAWWLAVILAALLLGGIGLLAGRMGPYWVLKYAVRTAPGGYSGLSSTSVVRTLTVGDDFVTYTSSSPASREVWRIPFAPGSVTAGGRALERLPSITALDGREG